MEDKKKIDRLFREKFKDFEVTPDDRVWKNIKADLQKEEKGLVLPLWSKIAGVAAVIAIVFLAGNYWFTDKPEAAFVKSGKEENAKQISTDSFEKSTTSDKKEKSLVREVTDNKEEKNQSETRTEAIAKSSSEVKETKKEAAITQQNHQESTKETESLSDKAKTKSALAEKQKSDEKSFVFEDNTDVNKKKAEEDFKKIAERESDSGKSLWEDIAKQEKDDFLDKKEESGRLSIRPNVAPIYYSSIGGGSAMDPQFADSKTQGRVTMAYGLDVAYKISNQLKVRAGISRLNMSYNTPDIAFAAAPRDISLKALNNSPTLDNSAVIQSVSKSKIEKSHSEMANMVSAYADGNLNQELTYIEVPLEVEYSLLDKRFGISLIGGASTLILNDDQISLHSGLETTELGRAANLNSVSFTTNLGMGFGYNLNKNLNFSVEPTLKYQINGFNGKTGDFKPYFLGVYSGLSFKF